MISNTEFTHDLEAMQDMNREEPVRVLPTPFYDQDGITLYCGDCREILPLFPDKSFDLCLTDPPYGMGRVMMLHGNDRKVHIDDALVAEWDSDFDVCKIPFPDCSLVAFTVDWRIPEWFSIRPNGRMAAWRKTNATPTFRGTIINAAEWIFFDAPVNYREWGNTQTVISGPFETTVNRLHPTQKPIWLMKELIEMFGTDSILDPFCGSGTTLVAAKQLGRKAVGIEISEKYCEIAVKRLAQMQLEFR